MIWRFKTSGQWREMPREFGAWSTVSNRFRQWRDAGVFEALLEGLITEAAKRGGVTSLKTIAGAAAGLPGPRVALVRSLTVKNVDFMGFVQVDPAFGTEKL